MALSAAKLQVSYFKEFPSQEVKEQLPIFFHLVPCHCCQSVSEFNFPKESSGYLPKVRRLAGKELAKRNYGED